MSYGISPQGFVRKPYIVILSEQQQKAWELYGDDVDLSSASPVGMMIELFAWEIDRMWALAEAVYYSLWLSTAEGVSLDRITQLGFVKRQDEKYAMVALTFTGDEGAVIAAGIQAETTLGIIFETVERVEIGESGSVDVIAQCTTPGLTGIVSIGAINSIKTPMSGVSSVTNAEASSGGRGIETDAELRERYVDLPAATGSSCEAIRAALRNLSQVRSSMVFENDGNAPDENGIPGKSFEAVVLGGNDLAIAMIILQKKPAGMQAYGSEEVIITDSQGNSKSIHFSRPEDIDVYITFDIVINSDWDENFINEIKRNAIAYVGGVDDLLIEHEGVGISNTVYAWKLISVQSEIIGVDEINVKLGRTSNPTETENLDFLTRERPRTDVNKIMVNIS